MEMRCFRTVCGFSLADYRTFMNFHKRSEGNEVDHVMRAVGQLAW